MNAVGVIPARFQSVRFEGKVLAMIHGKPMIQHVWERAKGAKLLDDLIVACDDDRIYKVVEDFGGRVVLTSKDHSSGTDRIAEVVDTLDAKIVVNIQGDEPMVHPSMIDGLVEVLLGNGIIKVATIAKRIENAEDINNPNVVKVVFDRENYALYFSRSNIPFVRDVKKEETGYYKHIGLYAYTKDFLMKYRSFPRSKLEDMEKLEQLRILDNGYRIKVVQTQFDTFGVDTLDDLENVKAKIKDS